MSGMNELAFVYLFVGGLVIIGAIIATLVISVVVSRNIALGFCVAVVVTILAAALGGANKISLFWDLPSIYLVIFTVIILVGGQGKWKLFLQGLQTSFSVSSIPNTPDTAETAALFRYLTDGTLLRGGLWMLTGLILVLSDFDTNIIGPGIAVSLLTLFYSLVLSLFLFRPIAHRYEQAARTTDVLSANE